jgi:hypothetical protein
MVDDLAELTALTVVGEETIDGGGDHVKPGPGVTLDQRDGAERPGRGLELALDLWITADGDLVKIGGVSSCRAPATRPRTSR